jgi:hypothetical protein
MSGAEATENVKQNTGSPHYQIQKKEEKRRKKERMIEKRVK